MSKLLVLLIRLSETLGLPWTRRILFRILGDRVSFLALVFSSCFLASFIAYLVTQLILSRAEIDWIYLLELFR